MAMPYATTRIGLSLLVGPPGSDKSKLWAADGTSALPEENLPVEEPPERIRRLVVLLSNSTHHKFKQLAAAKETTMAVTVS